MYEYKARKVNNKRIDEHRLVMENKLKRTLSRQEVVHHIDGNKRNNSIQNLQLMSLSEHSRLHLKGRRPKITTEQLILSGRKNRPAAKLKPSDIPVIRKMLKDGIFQWLIAWIYKVDIGTISKIKRKVRWAWVG